MELFCIRREGSYDETMHSFYIDNSILDNTVEFTANEISGGDQYSFKLPVGVFRYSSQNDATYITVFGKNNFQGCLVWYQGETRYAKQTSDLNPNAIGTSFGVQKPPTYGDAIPFFNNTVDASNYSRGLPYNADNWVGGKPLTPPYTWVSVPSVSGKNGILSLAQIASGSINDGEPVSDAAATAFSDLPAECNVGEIIDDLLPYEESLVDVLVKYKVKGAVTGAFDYVKLVAKKGSIPKSVEDGDKVVDINPSKKSKLVTDLDEGSKYYFVIFEKDSAGQTAQSSEKSITTGDLPEIGGEFTYSGEVEEFEVPVSGVYRLETWGAQGADATSGSNMARGGYGAYSVGEMFLKKGDILYVNVGGQNGYGGAN